MPSVAAFRRRVGPLVDPRARRVSRVRRELAAKYLHGEGIEIGALHKPLRVPAGVRVRYVDRMSADDLRHHYPELAGTKLVEPDVIADGELLEPIADGSVDFVVANHFIEHTEDPLATIANHLRVLRPGGVLYMGVPDKRSSFDRERPLTTVEHLARDHHDGPATSRADHYEEWARYVDRAGDVPARAQALMEQSYSIHFHVWTPDAFGELLEHARSVERLPFTIEEIVPNGFEFICILRKTAPDQA